MRGALRPALLLALLAGAAPAAANSGGRTGYSGAGRDTCNACHKNGLRPDVALAGPTSLAPGATATYRFSVRAASPVGRAAGLDIAAQAGQLGAIAGQGARVVNGELTHNEPKPNDADRTAAWEFLWTAPAAPGTYRLFGAGNSVNLNGQSSGDRSASTTLSIVVAVAADSPTPSPTPTATALPTVSATPAPPTATPTAPARPGDCDSDGTVAINELVVAVAIALDQQSAALCRAADGDGDARIGIDELIAAVAAALAGGP